jgi:hypothetical protein
MTCSGATLQRPTKNSNALRPTRNQAARADVVGAVGAAEGVDERTAAGADVRRVAERGAAGVVEADGSTAAMKTATMMTARLRSADISRLRRRRRLLVAATSGLTKTTTTGLLLANTETMRWWRGSRVARHATMQTLKKVTGS